MLFCITVHLIGIVTVAQYAAIKTKSQTMQNATKYSRNCLACKGVWAENAFLAAFPLCGVSEYISYEWGSFSPTYIIEDKKPVIPPRT